jgi:hypothetical protein
MPIGKSAPGTSGITQEDWQTTPPPEPPFTAGCLPTCVCQLSHLSHGDFVQADVLDGRPDNRQATLFYYPSFTQLSG